MAGCPSGAILIDEKLLLRIYRLDRPDLISFYGVFQVRRLITSVKIEICDVGRSVAFQSDGCAELVRVDR